MDGRRLEEGIGEGARDRAADRKRGRKWLPVALGLGVYLVAISALVGLLGFTRVWYRFFDVSDIPVYHAYAAAMDRGLRPFVDFPAEYPPLALRLFDLPGHPTDPERYALWFATVMLLSLAAASVLVAKAAARLGPGRWTPAIGALTFGTSVLALGAIVANRFDAVVALALALFLWATVSRRWVLAGLALGLGTALKLTPVIMLPLPLLLATRGRTRAGVLLAFAVAAAVPFLIEGRLAWDGLAAVVRFHGARPLQAESVLATPLLLAHLLGLQPVQMGTAFGSQFVTARGAPLLATVSAPLAAALLLVVYRLAWRGRERLRREPGALALVSLAALLAFLVPAKVLSPQFLVWLVPAVALLAPSAPGPAGLVLGILLVTQIEFPSWYWRFIALQPGPVLLVVARNIGLVAALAWVLVLLAGEGGRCRSATRT
jgi:hypothetical protein